MPSIRCKSNCFPKTETKIIAVVYSMGAAVIMIWLITMLSCNATIFHPLAERLVNSLPQNVTGILFPAPGSNESYYQRLELRIIANSSSTTDSPSERIILSTFSVTRMAHHTENLAKTTQAMQRKNTPEHSVTHSPTKLPTIHSVIAHSPTKLPILHSVIPHLPTKIPFPLPENPKNGILFTATGSVPNKGPSDAITKKSSKNANKANSKMINSNNKRRKRMANKSLLSSSSKITKPSEFKIVLNLTLTRDILTVYLAFNVFYFIFCLLLYLGEVKKGRYLILIVLWVIVDLMRQLAVFTVLGLVIWSSCIVLYDRENLKDVAIPLLLPIFMIIVMALSFYFWIVVLAAWRDDSRENRMETNNLKINPKLMDNEIISNKFLGPNNIANEKNVKWAWIVESGKIIT